MRHPAWCWVVLVAAMLAGPVAAQEVEQSYRDWALRCADGTDCVLEQRVFLEGAEGAPLVHIAFQTDEELQEPLMLLRVPLGVLLSSGLQLRIDQGAVRSLTVHHCHTQGCVGIFPLTPALRQRLESGREAQVSFHTLDGRNLGVPISLIGITAGLRALDGSAERDEQLKEE